MNITQKSSPNHYNGRNGWKQDMIACHITDGSYDGLTADQYKTIIGEDYTA